MFHFRTNVSIYFATNILVAIIPFLLMPVLTRYLGPGGYGVVAMFTTLITMLSPIIGLNVHNGLSKRWFDRDQFNIPEYVGGCITILLFSAVLVSVIFLGVEQWLTLKLAIPVFWLYGAIIVAVTAFLVQIRLVLWQVQEKPLQYGSLQFGMSAVNAILSYILIVFYLTNFEGRLWGYSASVFLFGIFSLFLLYKDGFLTLKIKWDYVKDALAFGVPLIPHVVGAIFLLMADRVIVNVMLGSSSAGIYMVAVQIALGFNLLNESFNKAFIPKLYALLKEGDATKKIFIIKLTYTYFVFLLIVPLCSIFISKYLVLILAGPKYLDAVPVLNWLILTQSFHGMYYLVTNYLFYECKTYITSGITILCGSFSIILTYKLIPYLGLVGAGIGSATGMFLQFLLTWIMAAKIHPMPWFSCISMQKCSVNNEII